MQGLEILGLSRGLRNLAVIPNPKPLNPKARGPEP